MELVRRPRERIDARTLTDTITSREEEDRQLRLQRENEELRRQISEVSVNNYNIHCIVLSSVIPIFEILT